ncbi:MAG: hypothetical protein ACRDU8_10490 [Egibacteraceae bacterium]
MLSQLPPAPLVGRLIRAERTTVAGMNTALHREIAGRRTFAIISHPTPARRL